MIQGELWGAIAKFQKCPLRSALSGGTNAWLAVWSPKEAIWRRNFSLETT